MENEFIILIISLIAAAGTAGFLAGLLGIGGGIILVPALYAIFSYLQYPQDYIMHIAIATTLATTIFTTISSAYAHYKHNAIDYNFFKLFAPAIITGVIIGTLIADMVTSNILLIFFGIMLFILAFLMFIDLLKLSNKITKIPKIIHFGAGTIIGCCSTLMGIGGATFNVPYMVLNKLCIRNAIATASLFSLSVALPATIGFIITGYDKLDEIPYTIGYINWLCLLLIIPFTVLIAPLGAKATHIINVKLLRKIFAIIMMIISIKMLYSSFIA